MVAPMGVESAEAGSGEAGDAPDDEEIRPR